jgi:hypothetical protein
MVSTPRAVTFSMQISAFVRRTWEGKRALEPSRHYLLAATLLALSWACHSSSGGSGTTVTLSPANATLGLLGQQQFTANVTGIPNSIVNWSLSSSGSSGYGCGYIDAAGLYHAPWSVPVSPSVTVTATYAADPTKSATATVAVQSAGPQLNGQYAFLVQGGDKVDTYVWTLWQMAGTFTADGHGNLTGHRDIVHMTGSPILDQSFSGTYTQPYYGKGLITLTTGTSGAPQTMAYVIGAGGNRVSLISLDTVPSTTRGWGQALKQDSTAFHLPTTSDDIVFGWAGSDYNASAAAAHVGLLGRFTLDHAGAVSNGYLDLNDGGVLSSNHALSSSGSISVSSTTGKATGQFTAGGVAYDVVAYLVDATEGFWMSVTKPDATHSMFGGLGKKQAAGPFSFSSLNTTCVFSLTGVANSAVGNGSAAIGVITLDGIGAITGGPMDSSDNAVPAAYPNLTGTYTAADSSTGRGTLHLSTGTGVTRDLIYYLISPNTAFLLDGAGSNVATGYLEARTGAPYSLASLNGIYTFCSSAPPTGLTPASCGIFQSDGQGFFWGLEDENDYQGNYANEFFAGTAPANWMPANGRSIISFRNDGTRQNVLYFVSPNRFLMFESSTVQHQPDIVVVER